MKRCSRLPRSNHRLTPQAATSPPMERPMNANDPAPASESPDSGAPPEIGAEQPHVAEHAPPAKASAPRRVAYSLWHFVLPMLFVSTLCVLLAYIAPNLLVHWKMMNADAEVEI